MLFKEKKRNYLGPKTHTESDFEYLDRSGQKDAERVREFLNEWISYFPATEVKGLISRIKSGDKTEFDSATFEIFLYALVRGLGGEIEVHPKLENRSEKRPDFLVQMPSGEEFYLEATLAARGSKSKRAAAQRTNVVFDLIEEIDSPNFHIGVVTSSDPETPPPSRKLRRALEAWVSALDPDSVLRDVENMIAKYKEGGGHVTFPAMTWEHEGWHVKFEAYPKRPERRVEGQRAIGSVRGGAQWNNIDEDLKDAICSKGGRYGELNKPFIIAVNVNRRFISRINEVEALFGQERWIYHPTKACSPLAIEYENNGAWYGPKGPRYTRVSGVWLFGALNPWGIVTTRNRLYFNPWAKTPAPDLLQRVNCARYNNEEMVWTDGEKISTLLGLPESWPE